jgi:hypothetical protein
LGLFQVAAAQEQAAPRPVSIGKLPHRKAAGNQFLAIRPIWEFRGQFEGFSAVFAPFGCAKVFKSPRWNHCKNAVDDAPYQERAAAVCSD